MLLWLTGLMKPGWKNTLKNFQSQAICAIQPNYPSYNFPMKVLDEKMCM